MAKRQPMQANGFQARIEIKHHAILTTWNNASSSRHEEIERRRNDRLQRDEQSNTSNA